MSGWLACPCRRANKRSRAGCVHAKPLRSSLPMMSWTHAGKLYGGGGLTNSTAGAGDKAKITLCASPTVVQHVNTNCFCITWEARDSRRP